jgi:hypothetical protein
MEPVLGWIWPKGHRAGRLNGLPGCLLPGCTKKERNQKRIGAGKNTWTLLLCGRHHGVAAQRESWRKMGRRRGAPSHGEPQVLSGDIVRRWLRPRRCSMAVAQRSRHWSPVEPAWRQHSEATVQLGLGTTWWDRVSSADHGGVAEGTKQAKWASAKVIGPEGVNWVGPPWLVTQVECDRATKRGYWWGERMSEDCNILLLIQLIFLCLQLLCSSSTSEFSLPHLRPSHLVSVTPWFLKRIEFYKVIYLNK